MICPSRIKKVYMLCTCTFLYFCLQDMHWKNDNTRLTFCVEGTAHVHERLTFSVEGTAHVHERLTFSVEGTAHVHESFGRHIILRFVTLEQYHSEVLHQSEIDRLLHTPGYHALKCTPDRWYILVGAYINGRL